MAQAYTPGLKRTEVTVVQKIRRLPIPGDVLVKVGDSVSHDQAVARTEFLGEPQVISIALHLLCEEPEDAPQYMLKKVGDSVKKGELIALKKSWFGWLRKSYFSEYDGTIEYISEASGQIIIREPPVPMHLAAYIPGKVVEVLPKEGVILECVATYLQGIFGVGGETHGEIMAIAESPSDVIEADKITSGCSGKILVGGSIITAEALHKAIDVGAKAVIVGGIKNKDLSDFLGYEIGVAITGHERIGLTLILTEGFGKMPMAQRSFELLKGHEGKLACINGATQIRAGVMRPEVVVPLKDINPEDLSKLGAESNLLMEGMIPGTPVRIIREPYFGALGRVASLPVELQRVETESFVRVLEVELDDGRHVVVPRANVEIIEE